MYQVGDLIGDYRVDAVLGSGGMGEVYKADHPRLPRADAIKVLRSAHAADPIFRARFEREADLVAPLKHANLVSIYDRGVFEGQLWIAMEYVEGPDASDLLEKRGRLDPRLVVEIIRGVAAGLGAAHQRGIMHRDIKPANIMVTLGENPTVPEACKLTDFGIAQALDEASKLTGTGTTVGTMLYASPEQIAAERIDARSDIYSLGATAFELLTGTPPFSGDTLHVLMTAHMFTDAPLATARHSALPPAVDAVLQRAMAKKPEARYQTAEAFATDLGNALANAAPTPPVVGTPGPTPSASPGWPPRPVSGGTSGPWNSGPGQNWGQQFAPQQFGQPGPGPIGPPLGPGATPHISAPTPQQQFGAPPTISGPAPQGHFAGVPAPQQFSGPQQFSAPQHFSGPQQQAGQQPVASYQPGGLPPFTPVKPKSTRRLAIIGTVAALVAALLGIGGAMAANSFSGIGTPDAPSATVTTAGVELSWAGVDGATSYVVQQSGEEIYSGPDTTYTVPTPIPGRYSYSVAARSDSSASDFSDSSEQVTITTSWGTVQPAVDIYPDLVSSGPRETDGYDEMECSAETGNPLQGTNRPRITCLKYDGDDLQYQVIVTVYADANEAGVNMPWRRTSLPEQPFTSADGTSGSKIVNNRLDGAGEVAARFDSGEGDKARTIVVVSVDGEARIAAPRADRILGELPL